MVTKAWEGHARFICPWMPQANFELSDIYDLSSRSPGDWPKPNQLALLDSEVLPNCKTLHPTLSWKVNPATLLKNLSSTTCILSETITHDHIWRHTCRLTNKQTALCENSRGPAPPWLIGTVTIKLLLRESISHSFAIDCQYSKGSSQLQGASHSFQTWRCWWWCCFSSQQWNTRVYVCTSNMEELGLVSV